MKETDYLNPLWITEQCDSIIYRLERDSLALETVWSALNAFIENNEIKSESYNALKQQISDYKTIIDAMRDANEADIIDCKTLKLSMKNEVLDGSNIYNQKDAALREKEWDEEMARSYEKDADETSYPWLKWYYKWKASRYYQMAELDQELYNKWQAKENSFDEIESITRGLFVYSQEIRKAALEGLTYISGVFQKGTYVPNTNASWRNIFSEAYRKQWYIEALKEYGYTQGEIDVLVAKGIILSNVDLSRLKHSKDTEVVYISDDMKAIIYNGKVYYIEVPKNTVSINSYWTLDDKKIFTKTDFDLVAGILGIQLEDIPKEAVYSLDNMYKLQEKLISVKDKNATEALILHATMGFGSFMLSSLKHTEVTLCFESNGDYRKVQIAVGNSETRKKFENINYNVPINTYQNSQGAIGQMYASDYAAGIYKLASGKSVPDENATYTIIGTLDERHKDCAISGYLSYSENGDLLYTPLVFTGDKGYIATCQKFTGFQAETIYDFTDKLSNPTIVDETTKKIFEQALENK